MIDFFGPLWCLEDTSSSHTCMLARSFLLPTDLQQQRLGVCMCFARVPKELMVTAGDNDHQQCVQCNCGQNWYPAKLLCLSEGHMES